MAASGWITPPWIAGVGGVSQDDLDQAIASVRIDFDGGSAADAYAPGADFDGNVDEG